MFFATRCGATEPARQQRGTRASVPPCARGAALVWSIGLSGASHCVWCTVVLCGVQASGRAVGVAASCYTEGMADVSTSRMIAAPADQVFDVVAHLEKFSEVNPNITAIEFLSESKTGVGTRFRETRRMGKREATTTLEVTEYMPPRMVRIVSDEGGTIWDTVFTVDDQSEGSTLTMRMDIKPYRFVARLMTPIAKRMVAKAIDHDMDAIKSHCEGAAG